MSFLWCKSERRNKKYYQKLDHEDKTFSDCVDRPLRSRRATAADKKINILALLLVPTIFYWFYFKNNHVRRTPYMEKFISSRDGIRIVTEKISMFHVSNNSLSLAPTMETFEIESSTSRDVVMNAELPICVITHTQNESSHDHKVKINYSLKQLNIQMMGGHYSPSQCKARYTVGIIVPFRNRKKTINLFLRNIHPFIIKQKLDYRLIIVEQSVIRCFDHGIFGWWSIVLVAVLQCFEVFEGRIPRNRGKLLNAGFLELMKLGSWDCVIFHDMDLLPTDDRISYGCPPVPRHLSTTIIGENKKSNPNKLFGGVTAMPLQHFEKVNGFSNLYWGSGGEDNDLFWRLKASGIKVSKLNKTIGVYQCLSNYPHHMKNNRFRLLRTATERFKADGLTTVKYLVTAYYLRKYYSHIIIDINPNNETMS